MNALQIALPGNVPDNNGAPLGRLFGNGVGLLLY
jgi:hypothetical protein